MKHLKEGFKGMLVFGTLLCIWPGLLLLQAYLSGWQPAEALLSPLFWCIMGSFVGGLFAAAFVGFAAYSYFHESPWHRATKMDEWVALCLGLGVLVTIFITVSHVLSLITSAYLPRPPLTITQLIMLNLIVLVIDLLPFVIALGFHLKAILYKRRHMKSIRYKPERRHTGSIGTNPKT